MAKTREELEAKEAANANQMRDLASSGVDIPDYYIDQQQGLNAERSQFLADEAGRTQRYAEDQGAIAQGQWPGPPHMTPEQDPGMYGQGTQVPLAMPQAEAEQAQQQSGDLPPVDRVIDDMIGSYYKQGSILTESQAGLRERAAEIADQIGLIERLNEKSLPEARREMEMVRGSYEQARKDMDSIRIDPNRWAEATPTLTKVLMAVASGMSSFANPRGPNPVIQAVDKAIERDLESQMATADMKLKQSNLGIESANVQAKLGQTLRSSMYMRAVGVLDQIMKHGQTEEAIFGAAMANEQLKQKALQIEIERYRMYAQNPQLMQQGQGQQMSQQDAMEASRPALAKIDRKAHEMVSATPGFLRSMSELIGLWSQADKSGTGVTDVASGYIPGTVENQYKRLMKNAALLEGAALQGKQLNEMELRAVQQGYPGLMDDQQTAALFFGRKLADIKKNVGGLIESNDQRADLRQARKAYDQILQMESRFKEAVKQAGWVK